MRTSTLLALASITLVAIIIRLLPMAQYLYWGADYGEYFAISVAILQEGRPAAPYYGWGIAYPYFPGMEAIAVTAHLLGLPLEASLLLLPPILASLSVVALFLLTWELTDSEGAGLVAAAFLALAMPHVYPTSHAIPGSIGDLFYISTLLAVLRARRDKRWMLLLAPLLPAIVLMHHFSTYFLIIALAAIPLLRILIHHRPWPAVAPDLGILGSLLLLTMAHWYLYAEVFRERVLTDEHTVPLWVSMVAFALPLVGFPLLLPLRSRLRWRYSPTYPEWGSARRHLFLAVAAGLAYVGLTIVIPIPGTTILLSSSAVLIFVPLMLLVAFAAVGRRYTELAPGGISSTALILSLLGSMALGLLITPRALIPYRHVEYLMVPAALFTGAGVASALPRISPGTLRRALAVGVAVLVTATALSAYPPREVMGGFFEGYPAASADPPAWIDRQLPPGAAVASDHRLSSMVFGLGGRNSTWDYVDATLHAPNFPTAAAEMRWLKTPAGYVRVDYVVLDDDVRRGAMLFPWEPARPLSPQANAKFEASPYVKVYDDGYSQVYWVNWAAVP